MGEIEGYMMTILSRPSEMSKPLTEVVCLRCDSPPAIAIARDEVAFVWKECHINSRENADRTFDREVPTQGRRDPTVFLPRHCLFGVKVCNSFGTDAPETARR